MKKSREFVALVILRSCNGGVLIRVVEAGRLETLREILVGLV
jgi:hypothetical protein